LDSARTDATCQQQQQQQQHQQHRSSEAGVAISSRTDNLQEIVASGHCEPRSLHDCVARPISDAASTRTEAAILAQPLLTVPEEEEEKEEAQLGPKAAFTASTASTSESGVPVARQQHLQTTISAPVEFSRTAQAKNDDMKTRVPSLGNFCSLLVATPSAKQNINAEVLKNTAGPEQLASLSALNSHAWSCQQAGSGSMPPARMSAAVHSPTQHFRTLRPSSRSQSIPGLRNVTGRAPSPSSPSSPMYGGRFTSAPSISLPVWAKVLDNVSCSGSCAEQPSVSVRSASPSISVAQPRVESPALTQRQRFPSPTHLSALASSAATARSLHRKVPAAPS